MPALLTRMSTAGPDVTGHTAYINMHDLALEVGDSLLGTTLGAPIQDDD
jgi:hypothetical protein